MINAGIVGLGWWGKVLVEAVQGKSDRIRFVAGATRTPAKAAEFAQKQNFPLVESWQALLADKSVDALVFATPHSQHRDQVIATARAGKHVFVEKPLTMTRADAEAAMAAVAAAKVSWGMGFNRRFAPAVAELRRRLAEGAFGTLEHCEATMSGPTGLSLPAEQWRANAEETPVGGLTPMGVHFIDLMIDLFGEIDEVYCQSFRRAVPNNTDDTSSMLFRMKNGMSAYMANMLATAPSCRVAVYGSKALATLHQVTLQDYVFQPVGGEREAKDLGGVDSVRAELDCFADACEGKGRFPVTPAQAIHGVAVQEAVIRSSKSHRPEEVG